MGIATITWLIESDINSEILRLSADVDIAACPFISIYWGFSHGTSPTMWGAVAGVDSVNTPLQYIYNL